MKDKKDLMPDVKDIESGRFAVENKEKPNEFDHSENERLLVENIKDIQSVRGLRETYAAGILISLACYAVIVIVFLLLGGFSIYGFTLPDMVLITLVGSTAVAAIGLVGIIAKGLFDQTK